MTDLFNKQHFGSPITVAQLTGFVKNHKLRNGFDGRFRPGCVSLTKGTKGFCKGSSTSWKPGHKPYNYVPVGSERVTTQGYVQIKISDRAKRKWRFKQLVIWEEANGKLPKGHAVIFADGNNRNFALDNLLLVSRKQLMVMNHLGLIAPYKDLTALGKAVADVKLAIGKRIRGKRGTKRGRPATAIRSKAPRKRGGG